MAKKPTGRKAAAAAAAKAARGAALRGAKKITITISNKKPKGK
jgi:hypothetical protein